MRPAFATVEVTLDLPYPPAEVFAHWVSPETRVRWEAGPDSGMTYEGFDTRPGGVETIRVHHDGGEIGRLVQRVQSVDDGSRIVSTIEGHFNDTLSLLLSVVVSFEPTDIGTRIIGQSQIVDLSGRDPKADHTTGWGVLMNAFETDIETHGLIGRT